MYINLYITGGKTGVPCVSCVARAGGRNASQLL